MINGFLTKLLGSDNIIFMNIQEHPLQVNNLLLMTRAYTLYFSSISHDLNILTAKEAIKYRINLEHIIHLLEGISRWSYHYIKL